MLSAVAGITFYNFYFRLYPGTVKSPQVIDFLQALLQHISGPLLIVWDRLAAHRSGIVRDFISGGVIACGWNTFRLTLRS